MSAYYDKAEYVLTIAEEGNISRAAEKLYVSQSTLTMYLNRLEAEFGTPLFDRSARPIVPTQAGLLYINDLLAVQRMERSFLSNLRHLRNPNETLNIGIGPIRSRLYMPTLLGQLREIYPDISIDLTELSDDKLPAGLVQGKHDVIFGGFVPSSVLFAQMVEIGEEPMGLIAPKSYGWSDGISNTPRDPVCIGSQRLKPYPVIIPGEGSDLHDQIVNTLHRWVATPSSVIMTQSTATAIGLVAEGLGYAFVEYPFLQIVGADVQARLDYLTVEGTIFPNRKVTACYSKKSIKRDVIETAIDLFSTIFKG